MKKQIKLCLHCGGEVVSLNDIKNVITPKATETHTPIPHFDYIAMAKEAMASAGLEVTSEQHALAKDGARYFGLLQISKRGMNPNDYALVAGLRNSHDKRFPASIVGGGSVFVCDNLSFSGEVKETRKHTVHIMRDIKRVIFDAVAALNDSWADQETRFETYKETNLPSAMMVHDLVIRAYDVGAIPATYIPHVLNEYRNPTHEAFRNKNVWSLFNAFTEKLKDSNVHELADRTARLQVLLDEHAGIALRRSVIDI